MLDQRPAESKPQRKVDGFKGHPPFCSGRSRALRLTALGQGQRPLLDTEFLGLEPQLPMVGVGGHRLLDTLGLCRRPGKGRRIYVP